MKSVFKRKSGCSNVLGHPSLRQDAGGGLVSELKNDTHTAVTSVFIGQHLGVVKNLAQMLSSAACSQFATTDSKRTRP